MTANPILQALVPLLDDLARELPDGERYRRLLQAMQALLPCDAVALLRLEGDVLVPLATPANWVPGQDVIVALSLDDAAAEAKYGKLDKKLPYLRFARDPKRA